MKNKPVDYINTFCFVVAFTFCIPVTIFTLTDKTTLWAIFQAVQVLALIVQLVTWKKYNAINVLFS